MARWCLVVTLVGVLAMPAQALDMSDQRRSATHKREDAPGIGPCYARQSGYRMPRASRQVFPWSWNFGAERRKIKKSKPATRVIVRRGERGEKGERGASGQSVANGEVAPRHDCAEVNAAVAALPADKLARALLRSTNRQKVIIAECQERQPPIFLEGFR